MKNIESQEDIDKELMDEMGKYFKRRMDATWSRLVAEEELQTCRENMAAYYKDADIGGGGMSEKELELHDAMLRAGLALTERKRELRKVDIDFRNTLSPRGLKRIEELLAIEIENSDDETKKLHRTIEEFAKRQKEKAVQLPTGAGNIAIGIGSPAGTNTRGPAIVGTKGEVNGKNGK